MTWQSRQRFCSHRHLRPKHQLRRQCQLYQRSCLEGSLAQAAGRMTQGWQGGCNWVVRAEVQALQGFTVAAAHRVVGGNHAERKWARTFIGCLTL